MSNLIIGIFDSITQADKAINDIRASGFDGGISLVTKENSTYFDELDNIKSEYQSDAKKFQNGGVIGGLVGLAVGSFIAPGIGTVFALGPLAGLFAGALSGETVEAALNYGITKKNKEYYSEQIKEGKSIVAVEGKDANENNIIEIFNKYKAGKVDQK